MSSDLKEFTGAVAVVIAAFVAVGLVIFIFYRYPAQRPVARTCTYRETGTALIIECPVQKP